MIDPLLLILVDGMPFHRVNAISMPYLNSWARKGPLTPGLGFSINIYPELFAARQPDDLGYFNKWRLRSRDELKPGYRAASALGRVADLSRRSQFVSRGLHKVWEKLTGQGNLANIPFAYLPYFARNPDKEEFTTREYPTFFNERAPRLILSYKYRGALGDKDRQVTDDALAAIPSGGDLFLLLGDLDTLAHTRGAGEPFERYLAEMDRLLEQLATAFRKHHGDSAHVVVLSDHGMAKVEATGAVRVNLVKQFGPARYERYVPFLDALMLRLWGEDEALLGEMAAWLNSLGVGHTLRPEERARYGVRNPDFGKVLFLLDEGRAFFPSWFGAKFPLAMHGYDPALESQQAFFGCLGPAIATLPLKSMEVYPFLKTLGG